MKYIELFSYIFCNSSIADDSDAVFTDDEDIIREQKKKRGLKRFFAR